MSDQRQRNSLQLTTVDNPAAVPERPRGLRSATSRPDRPTHHRIATLGPAGTSSEAAARHLVAVTDRSTWDVELFNTYELAAQAVLDGLATKLLVANAYSGVNDFYMDLRLQLNEVFVLDTPRYGIAARPDRPVPLEAVIVTHPAPRALINQLLPQGYRVRQIRLATSTSSAARQVAKREVDLALTTAPAAAALGLNFISDTRPIRMVWSAFTPNAASAPFEALGAAS
jgi:prephenate dehydratase